MTRFLKRFWIVFCLALMLPLSFFGVEEKSHAQTNNDFIKYAMIAKEDGKINVTMILSCSIPGTYNNIEIAGFKARLIDALNHDIEEKKAQIISKYSQEQKEEFNPEETIVVGKAVQSEEEVGYSFEYSSLKVFQYYNNIETSYKEGFFTDKSKYLLDNPFNDVIEVGNTLISVAEKYKNIYLTASQGYSFEEYVVDNYSPIFYNNYMTLNRRTKSNADLTAQDSNGYYHHMWLSDEVNLIGDYEMKLSLNIIHAGWWYLLGTALPLGVMTVAIIIIKISKNKPKTEITKEKEK